ncbi:MAG: hypothetical protein JO301_09495 [Chitinophagaceae bacterium]|nr:hypothetical protein [Chitinophagaceae bacterium]
MQQHLHKFLILHRSLHIPQLGSFCVREEPARADTESRLLFAPRPVISFNNSDKSEPDATFFHFLSREMSKDEDEARTEFNRFCSEFRNSLQQLGIAVIPGVGRLVSRNENDLIFTPESSLLDLLPPVAWHEGEEPHAVVAAAPRKTKQKRREEPAPAPVAAAPVVHEQGHSEEPDTVQTEEETISETTRDRWWVYAIILLAAGILALLFYYQ